LEEAVALVGGQLAGGEVVQGGGGGRRGGFHLRGGQQTQDLSRVVSSRRNLQYRSDNLIAKKYGSVEE
jgi:hypothetical protein